MWRHRYGLWCTLHLLLHVCSRAGVTGVNLVIRVVGQSDAVADPSDIAAGQLGRTTGQAESTNEQSDSVMDELETHNSIHWEGNEQASCTVADLLPEWTEGVEGVGWVENRSERTAAYDCSCPHSKARQASHNGRNRGHLSVRCQVPRLVR